MTQRYHPIQIVLHWLIVVLVILQYATSGAIVRTHEAVAAGDKPGPTDLLLHVFHNRVGLIITGLMVVRLMVWIWIRHRPHPNGSPVSSNAAKVGHAALYSIIITQGTTGALASYIWWPISIVHVLLFKVLVVAVAGHVAMALWHEFVRRDGTLRRMVPFRAARRSLAGTAPRHVSPETQ